MVKLSVYDIEKAKESFSKLIKETPLEYNSRLSKEYSCNVYLKREDLQVVRSYKIRGAFNSIRQLKDEEKKGGVVCASAGNHAQGVAISCKEFKIKGRIYMPLTTPKQKVRATKKFGGKYVEIILVGDTFDESYFEAMKYSNQNNSKFIHPFNDLDTIIGQGTIGKEILDKCEESIDYLFVPIGGGGLISGLGSYFNQKSPNTKIIGVEPRGAASMKRAIEENKSFELEEIETFVDGASVKKVGERTFEISKGFINKIVTIPENRLCSSILDFLQEEGVVLEPAGVLSVDALKSCKDEIKGKNIVCILSGGNFDFDRLIEVKERSKKYEGLKKYYSINFPQRAGALKEFLSMLGEKDDIIKFEYSKKHGRNKAPVFIGLETNLSSNFDKLEEKMEKSQFSFEDITENQLVLEI